MYAPRDKNSDLKKKKKNHSVQMPFDLLSYRGKAEELALIDSGATGNFIDHRTIVRYRLGTKQLSRPIPIRNVDGTNNRSGQITQYIDLFVSKGQQCQRTRFLVTNLGTDRVILGYPWLAQFNPDIDWPKAKVLGPRVQIETIAHGKTPPTVPETINKTTIAQQMAQKAHESSKTNDEVTLPESYKQHAKVFSEQEAKRFPPTRPFDHRICLKPEAPDVINCRMYPLSKAETEAQNKYLDENLEKGFISVSDSKYGFPTFTVLKKDGTHRFVVDYRKLNQHTQVDVTPLPRISTIIEEMGDKTLFSKFDVREGYHNIQIVPEDRWKTAFKTSRGLFEYNVMSFGLCNAPATFSRFIAFVVAPLYKKYPGKFRHYMDDIIVATGPGEERLHEEICHQLFELLEKNSLFLKASKCIFGQPEVDFLGVRLGHGQITADPSKVAGIKEWPRNLYSVKQVRSTLGVLGFQRPFIPGFAQIAKPITDLLKKGAEFRWTQGCTNALNQLINIVTSSPILIPPNPDRQFVLEVDASQYATGAILYQADPVHTDRKGRPILRACGYHSQTFSATEQRYPIYDREYLAVIRGLRHWSYLLKGTAHPVIILTDHRNLLFYQEPHKLSNRVAGWVNEQSQYNLKIAYKPGATNRADALSRRPDYAPDASNDDPIIALPADLFITPETLKNVPVIEIKQPHHIRVTEATEDDLMGADLESSIIAAQSEHQDTLERWHRAHGLETHSGLWWKEHALVVVGNDNLRKGVTHLFHDSPTAGHPGIAKTTALVAQHYWWPGMRDFITQYIKGCAICQMSKVNTNPQHPQLFPITPETNALPFQTIALDFITKLPVSNGYDTILTITDHDCTKASIFIPCNETVDTPEVVKLYATHVFPHYGIPKKIISDRDPRFTSAFAKELCNLLGVHQNISTAYHPQTDGQSERTNQSLEQYLRLYCGNNQKDWANWLPIAQYTRNSWPHSTTKKTPYDLLIGYTPQAHQPSRTPHLPDIETRLSRITEARSAAQEAMRKVQNLLVRGRDKFKPYLVGNKVWLEGTNLKLPYDTPKLSPRRYGPFEVVAIISPVAYKLRLPETWNIHPVFHASLLTPYNETKQHGPNFIEPPPDIIEGEPEWEVEQVLGSRRHGQWKKLQYLVRWKGYSPAHDSWVAEGDIYAPDLVAQYYSSHPEAIRKLTIDNNCALDQSDTPFLPKDAPPFPNTPTTHTMDSSAPISVTSSPVYREPSSQKALDILGQALDTYQRPSSVRPQTTSTSVRHSRTTSAQPPSTSPGEPGTVSDLRKTWELSVQATRHYLQLERYPWSEKAAPALSYWVEKMAALESPPQAVGDLFKEEDVDLYPRFHNAIRDFIFELSPYQSRPLSPPPLVSEETVARRTLLERISSPQSDHEPTPDALHPGLGWTEFDPTNNNHYPVIYTDDGDNQVVARYFRIDTQGPQTFIEGTMGRGQPIWRQVLHAQPYPVPQTNRHNNFSDLQLQVFHPDASVRLILDQALAELADPGIIADVKRFCLLKRELATAHKRKVAAECEEVRAHSELIHIEKYLIHSRVCTRVIDHLYGPPPAPPGTASLHRSSSPLPKRIPPLRAGQGPADSSSTLGKRPRANLDPPRLFCVECWTTRPDHAPQDCPRLGTCAFCQSSSHESQDCRYPHSDCTSERCRVPRSHPFFGATCPAPLANALTLEPQHHGFLRPLTQKERDEADEDGGACLAAEE